jgi:mono/diheme cytochrome c family protein
MHRALLAASACLVLAAFTGCKQLPPPTPLSQLNAQQLRGHDVFQAACARCHNDRTTYALHGPALYGLYRRQYLPSGAAATDERVTATIQHGRDLMPEFGDKLSPQQLDDLLAYLHTL